MLTTQLNIHNTNVSSSRVNEVSTKALITAMLASEHTCDRLLCVQLRKRRMSIRVYPRRSQAQETCINAHCDTLIVIERSIFVFMRSYNTKRFRHASRIDVVDSALLRGCRTRNRRDRAGCYVSTNDHDHASGRFRNR